MLVNVDSARAAGIIVRIVISSSALQHFSVVSIAFSDASEPSYAISNFFIAIKEGNIQYTKKIAIGSYNILF
jgi:hypothetical protein